MAKFILKFLSGKYQGGEFPVPREGELILGRAAEVDIVLVEDMVSRRHAAIKVSGDELEMRDLGSTNGTFVNGEKLSGPLLLRAEDRLLVGTSILKLVDVSTAILPSAGETTQVGRPPTDAATARDQMAELGKKSAAEQSTMSGDLEEAPLGDLLTLFAANRRPGVLTLEGEPKGRGVLSETGLHSATVLGSNAMSPQKALCRLLAKRAGRFTFEVSREAPTSAPDFSGSLEEVLLECARQQDEMQRLTERLGGASVGLALMVPLVPKLSELAAEELEVLQAAINKGTVAEVLESSPLPDHDLMGTLVALVEAGYLQSA